MKKFLQFINYIVLRLLIPALFSVTVTPCLGKWLQRFKETRPFVVPLFQPVILPSNIAWIHIVGAFIGLFLSLALWLASYLRRRRQFPRDILPALTTQIREAHTSIIALDFPVKGKWSSKPFLFYTCAQLQKMVRRRDDGALELNPNLTIERYLVVDPRLWQSDPWELEREIYVLQCHFGVKAKLINKGDYEQYVCKEVRFKGTFLTKNPDVIVFDRLTGTWGLPGIFKWANKGPLKSGERDLFLQLVDIFLSKCDRFA